MKRLINLQPHPLTNVSNHCVLKTPLPLMSKLVSVFEGEKKKEEQLASNV